jgi:hypothetical protein
MSAFETVADQLVRELVRVGFGECTGWWVTA